MQSSVNIGQYYSNFHPIDKRVETGISLKYGGLEVSAEDANYDNYLDLGLVCQHCLSPIYWKKERKVKDWKYTDRDGNTKTRAGYTAKAHFAHFSNEQSQQCQILKKRSSLR